MANTLVQQLFLDPEASEGAYVGDATLVANANAVLGKDVEITPSVVKIPRNAVRSSLSTPADQIGRKTWEFAFGLDFHTGGQTGGVPDDPDWLPAIQACGVRRHQLRKIDVTGAIASGFTHDELISNGAGATARIVGSYTVAATYTQIVYRLTSLTDFGPAELISGTGGGSVSTPTGATPTNAGAVLMPSTPIVFSIDLGPHTGTSFTLGEIVTGSTSGAAGKVLALVPDVAGGTLYFEALHSVFQAGVDVLTGEESGAVAGTLTASLLPVANYTVSMGANKDGMLVAARGARGTFQLSGVAGNPMNLLFRFVGSQQAIDDYPPLAGYAPSTTLGKILESANFTMAGVAYRMANFSLDHAAETVLSDDANQTEGLEGIRLPNRVPLLTVDPAVIPTAVHDPWAAFANGTLIPVQMRLGAAETELFLSGGTYAGTNLGETLWVDVPAAQYDEMAFGDREGVLTYAKTLKPRQLSGDDDSEWRIYIL